MTKGAKTALVLAGVGGLVFLAMKFAKGSKGKGLPPVDVMREYLWESFVTKYPESAQSKETYFKSDAFNNVDFMIAWYQAKTAGKPTFNYNNMTWRSDDGMGV